MSVAVLAAGFFIFGLNQEGFQKNNEKKLWGAYAGNDAFSFGEFEELAGREADIQAVFLGWGEPFPENLVFNKNKILVIFWEQYDVGLDKIISGQEDNYILQFAKDAKDYGKEVILAPLHEMNGNWSPWSGTVGGNTPEKVVLAFQRMHDVFFGMGILNVKWAWVVNNESVPDTEENAIASYYPGDSYVDYAGVDGFNFGNPWQTYSEIFSLVLEKLRVYKKPILIASMASAPADAEALAGEARPTKAEWIKDALNKIYSDPSIKGFIWFNENKEKNWLVNSDPDSLQAFRDGIDGF